MPHHDLYIAGLKFREGASEYLESLPALVIFELEPEPDNKFDPNAIKILHAGFHLGYVPRHLTAEISGLINNSRIDGVTFPDAGKSGSKIVIHYKEQEPKQ